MAIFIIQIVLSAVGIIVNLVWLQLCYICYHLVGLRMCFMLAQLIIMRVFCLLPIQVAGVKVFIVIGQMGLSVAGVNIESCAVAVVLHHLLFGEFTHVCFIIATFIITLFYLLPFRWLVSGLFLSFR